MFKSVPLCCGADVDVGKGNMYTGMCYVAFVVLPFDASSCVAG